jgi:hypothetical protein
MNPVNQLIHEVAQQRQKIDQLGSLIQTQFLQKPPTGPGPTVRPGSVPGSAKASNQPPPMPTRQPMQQLPMTPSARPPAAVMGSPVSSYAASEIGSPR